MTHRWFAVSNAVSVCVQCRAIRRYIYTNERNFPLTEYLRIRVHGDGEISASIHPKAGECEDYNAIES